MRRYETWRLADTHRRAVAALPPHPGPALDEATRRQALEFVGSLVRGYRDLRWHEAYARTGRPSPFYLPDDIYFALVLPALNPADRTAILADRNHLDRIEGFPPLPATVGRLLKGRLLDAHFRPATTTELTRQLPRDARLVVKPSRGSGALVLVEVSALAGALDGRTDAIIQLPVTQHRDLTVLNVSTLNTLRVITWRRLDGEVLHLGTCLRIGRGGPRIDAAGTGHVYCGIDSERGLLLADGCSNDGTRVYQAHPDSGLLFAERKVPGATAARDAYVAAHRQLPWIDLAAWDIAIDTTGHSVTLDLDFAPAIGVPQLALGPIFAPVADDLRQRIGVRRHSRLLGFV